MKLKICGMKYQDNIDEIVALQPDYLGLIFYDKSPRYLDTTLTALPTNIKKTGVFVNASISEIIEKIIQYQLQAVQLHGKESVEFCLKLREAYEQEKMIISKEKTNALELIKAFSIHKDFNFSLLEPYQENCDYFLFDTKGSYAGGNGYTFNWDLLKKYSFTTPYFLSGGIGLDEIQQLQHFMNSPEAKYCYAIDVNSKFETKAGWKNITALTTFKKRLALK